MALARLTDHTDHTDHTEAVEDSGKTVRIVAPPPPAEGEEAIVPLLNLHPYCSSLCVTSLSQVFLTSAVAKTFR